MAVIRHPKDFFAGLLFIAFGVGAIVIGSNYALGTAARMGPGYFPRILGILMVTLGLLLVLRALWVSVKLWNFLFGALGALAAPPALRKQGAMPGTAVPAFKWRATLVVLGSVVLFGLVVQHLGLLVSTVGLIVGASAASHEFRWKEALVSGIFFALLAIAVFVLGLKLQLPIWPVFLFGAR